jgi:phosphoglycerol transferase MdoB-like AlkP superfamily enzyme
MISINQTRWTQAILLVRVWLIPAGLFLLLKYLILGDFLGLQSGGGYLEVSRIWGIQLTPLQRLGFFRDDFILLLVLIPAGLILIARFVHFYLAYTLLTIVSIVSVFFVFIQAKAYLVAGQFLSYDALRDAVVWAMSDNDAAGAYVKPIELACIAAAFLFTCGALVWNAWHTKQAIGNPAASRRWRRGTLGYLVLAGLLIVLSVLPQIPKTPFQVSSLAQSLKSFAGEQDDKPEGSQALSDIDLIQAFRTMTSTNGSNTDSEFRGRESGANLIFVVLETTPFRCMPVDGDMTALPALRELRVRSLIGLRHYATYVFTSRNLLSLFTGWYPSSRRRDPLEKYPGRSLPSIVGALRDRGYDSAVYAPVHDLFAMQDEKLFRSLGFQKFRYGAENFSDGSKENDRDHWQDKAKRDRAALELMLRDIDDSHKSGRSFVSAFLPQMGHAPWPDLSGKKNPDRVARCQLIASLQDKWIGELTDHLRSLRLLENTVIVVVGDHGIRNQLEDPSLPRTVIDDYSFHVPLLIYAPHSKGPYSVALPTSHIDISPTLYQLFGLKEDVTGQGLPLWDPAIAKRSLFLLANSFSMTDAMVLDKESTLCNSGTDAVYVSPSVSFPENTRKVGTTVAANQSCQQITRFRGLQNIWLDRFSRR